MFCSQCGNSIIETAKFCSKCGNTIQSIDSNIGSVGIQAAQQSTTPIDITSLNKEFIESSLFNKLIKKNVNYYRNAFLKISPVLNLSVNELHAMGAIERLKRLCSFNWAAGLFGSLWLAYRKAYLPALYIMFVEISLSWMMKKISTKNDDIASDITLMFISFIIIGFFGNNVYYTSLIKKLKTVKNQQDLEDVGGTSTLMVWAFIGLGFILGFIQLALSGK